MSAARPSDDKVVICESAIDAISYAQLAPDGHARYASTGGVVGRKQLEMLTGAIRGLTAGSTIVLATDADAGGDRIADQLAGVAAGAGVTCRRHTSPVGKDWNDCLKRRERAFIRDLAGPGLALQR